VAGEAFSGFFLFRGMDTIVDEVMYDGIETPETLESKYRARHALMTTAS
jgi:hypothetical protein